MLSLLTTHLSTPCPSQVANCGVHSWLLCLSPCPHFPPLHDTFLLFMAFPSVHITLPFITLSIISSTSLCLDKTVLILFDILHFLSTQNYLTPSHCWYTPPVRHSNVTHLFFSLKHHHLTLPYIHPQLPSQADCKINPMLSEVSFYSVSRQCLL